MLKFSFAFLLSVLFLQDAKAAVTDTVLIYLKNSGRVVATKDSADYFRFVMSPDMATDSNFYRVCDFYFNGKPKFFAKSLSNWPALVIDGYTLSYFPNGNRRCTRQYKNGYIVGEELNYYPNGKLYFSRDVDGNTWKLKELRDSTGNVLAENGTGHIVIYDINFKNITEEGDIKNSMREGQWRGLLGDTGKYVCVFHKDVLKSGITYLKSGKQYAFKDTIVKAVFDGGISYFWSFLRENIVYPKFALDHKLNGDVVVGFTIDKSGAIQNVHIVNGLFPCFNEEVMRVMKSSPMWTPGISYGMLADQKLIVSIFFGQEGLQFGALQLQSANTIFGR